jgi:hypothetical protein
VVRPKRLGSRPKTQGQPDTGEGAIHRPRDRSSLLPGTFGRERVQSETWIVEATEGRRAAQNSELFRPVQRQYLHVSHCGRRPRSSVRAADFGCSRGISLGTRCGQQAHHRAHGQRRNRVGTRRIDSCGNLCSVRAKNFGDREIARLHASLSRAMAPWRYWWRENAGDALASGVHCRCRSGGV